MAAYLPWALFAMITYGAVAVMLKMAFKGLPVSIVVVISNTAVVLGGVIWATTQGSDSYRNLGFNQHTAWLGAAGLVLAAAILAYYKALSLGPASIVVPIFALSSTVAATLGILVLGEQLTLTKVGGLVLAAAAIVLLTR